MVGFSFAAKSFLNGMGHTVDLGSTMIRFDFENLGLSEETDAHELYGDWVAVGNDMRQAAESIVK